MNVGKFFLKFFKLRLRNRWIFKKTSCISGFFRIRKFALTDGNYQFRDEKDGLVGVFHANDKGFGFVSWNPEDKESDIYIGPADTKLAMNNDKVRVIITTPAGNGRGLKARICP